MNLRPFLRSSDGSATIEFVVVFLGFIAIIFFVVEVTLYLFFMASIEKAAQAGARAAVVSPPVVSGVPPVIQKTAGGVFGFKCSDPSAPCVSFGTLSCTGAACQAIPFTRILNHMRGYNAQIEAEHVTVVYSDIGLGFAGGPATPMVTVSVSGLPFRTGIVGLLLTNANVLAVLPARSASMTGEDMAL